MQSVEPGSQSWREKDRKGKKEKTFLSSSAPKKKEGEKLPSSKGGPLTQKGSTEAASKNEPKPNRRDEGGRGGQLFVEFQRDRAIVEKIRKKRNRQDRRNRVKKNGKKGMTWKGPPHSTRGEGEMNRVEKGKGDSDPQGRGKVKGGKREKGPVFRSKKQQRKRLRTKGLGKKIKKERKNSAGHSKRGKIPPTSKNGPKGAWPVEACGGEETRSGEKKCSILQKEGGPGTDRKGGGKTEKKGNL